MSFLSKENDPIRAMRRLHITPRQWRNFGKWACLFFIFVLSLVVQDVILSSLKVLGGTFQLVPALLLVISLTQGTVPGGIFSLAACCIWSWSGAGLGAVSVVVLPIYGMLASALTDAFFRRGFSGCMVFCAIGLLLHQSVLFLAAVFLELTTPAYWLPEVVSVLLSIVICPLFYGIVRRIGRTGG